MLNRVVLIGRLTRDIELKHVGSDGVAFTRFSIAVNRKFQKDEADFINIIAWRKTAELCAQYLAKGSQVAIDGRIETGRYENQEGQTIYTTDIVAEDVRFLTPKEKQNNQSSTRTQQQQRTNRPTDPFADDGKPIDIDLDDLPF